MGFKVGQGAIEAKKVESIAGARSHCHPLTSRCRGLGVYGTTQRAPKRGSGLQSGDRCQGIGDRALAQIELSLFFARNL